MGALECTRKIQLFTCIVHVKWKGMAAKGDIGVPNIRAASEVQRRIMIAAVNCMIRLHVVAFLAHRQSI